MEAFVIALYCSLFMMIFTQNIEVNPSPNGNIICPDAVSVCPSNSTCCIATDGDYSCCPIKEGVCCTDHIHCCPQHYKCDLKIFKCDRVFNSKMLGVEPSIKMN
jgi:hypothetical protein